MPDYLLNDYHDLKERSCQHFSFTEEGHCETYTNLEPKIYINILGIFSRSAFGIVNWLEAAKFGTIFQKLK